MRKTLFTVLLVAFLCISCEILTPQEGYQAKGKVRIVCYGSTYEDVNSRSTTYYCYEESRYTQMGLKFNPIPVAPLDARSVASGFENLCEKTGRPYETYILTNETGPVSLEAFTSVLSQIAEEAEDEDLLIVYYTGHGCRISNKSLISDKTGYVTYGADLSRIGYISFCDASVSSYKLLSYHELYRYLDLIKGKKALFIDSCFGGSAVPTDGYSFDRVLHPEDDYVFTYVKDIQIPDIFVLSASQYYRVSYFNNISSIFTRALCESLGYDIANEVQNTRIPALSKNTVAFSSIAEYVRENYSTHKKDAVFATGTPGAFDLILF